jgi:hypothetical protein
MLHDKVNHVLWSYYPQRNHLNPFSKIIYYHQYELMSFAWRWKNLADQVDSPTSKWPWIDYWVHSWSRRSLNITKPLIVLTSFIIFKAVFQYCWQKISRPTNNPFHLISRLMSPHKFLHALLASIPLLPLDSGI